MVLTIGTGDIGDVPDRIRTGCIHDRTTCEGVRETFGSPLRVVLVVTGCLERTIPEGRVQTVMQFAVRRLFGILVDDVLILDSIEQPRTVHTDRVLQFDFVPFALEQSLFVTIALVIDINSRVRHRHFRIA